MTPSKGHFMKVNVTNLTQFCIKHHNSDGSLTNVGMFNNLSVFLKISKFNWKKYNKKYTSAENTKPKYN